MTLNTLATHEQTATNQAPPEPHKRGVADRLTALLPLTFKWQAVLFLLPMIIIISAVYTLESISTERKILRTEIINKGETIATIAARNAELPLLSENREQLENSARALMEIKDVAFVSFLNNHVEILQHEGKKAPLPATLKAGSDSKITFFEHDDAFEFIVPVVSVKAAEEFFLLEGAASAPPIREQIGWVRVGLSKKIMSQSERQIIRRGVTLALLFSAAGLALLYLLITLATRPLYALINATKEVRKGEHPEVNVVLPSSEIGQLSTEFNRMSRAIREREDALQETIMELEQSQDQLQENVVELEQTQEQLQDNVVELEQTQAQLQDNVQELEMQIEAREAAEAELTRHRDKLEELVIERTAQLTVAKEQAESANRAKSDFLSSMSHELRTPLNAILGYAQILKRQDNINETQQHQLEIMRNSGEHLLMLINDILDVSKIEAGKMEIADLPFDLPALLQQVYNLTSLQAEEKELRFSYEASGDLPQYVQGDDRKLRQILLNLLSNAVKYTRRGGVTLKVSYSHQNGGLLRCEVADTGIGIAADKLEAVFEPFTQLATNRQVREGTGLGLNITRQLLTLMQGRIDVESSPGSGSVFRIELPLRQVTELEVAPEKQQQSISGYQGERRNILVVDDNINNTAMLVSLLEPLGFNVTTAENGAVALQRAAERRPDLAIMDLVMPEMDGLECVRELRTMEGLSALKVIGASATVTDSASKETFMTACDAFVSKPIRIDPLLERIGELLGITWDRTASKLPPSIFSAAADHADNRPEIPPRDELKMLHELALLGDVRKIQAWAIKLEESNPRYQRFAGKLRELAGSYRTKDILALLNEQ